MSSLAVSTRHEDGRAIVSLDGELDLATVPKLRDAAMAELDHSACTTLVLDLENLTFLDSTGLGCWIELRNHADELHKQLELASIPPAAQRTVAISGLSRLFGLDPGPAGPGRP